MNDRVPSIAWMWAASSGAGLDVGEADAVSPEPDGSAEPEAMFESAGGDGTSIGDSGDSGDSAVGTVTASDAPLKS